MHSIDNWQEKLKSQLDHELPSDFAKVGNPLGDDKTYDECSPRDRVRSHARTVTLAIAVRYASEYS